MRRARARLDASGRLLETLHPNKPLERGYAKVEARATGRVVDTVDAARAAGAVTLHFRDGAVDAQVGLRRRPASQTARKPRAGDAPGATQPIPVSRTIG